MILVCPVVVLLRGDLDIAVVHMRGGYIGSLHIARLRVVVDVEDEVGASHLVKCRVGVVELILEDIRTTLVVLSLVAEPLVNRGHQLLELCS